MSSPIENKGFGTSDMIKMLKAMVGLGLICAFLIVVTYEGTLPRIERLKAEALEQAIYKVIPEMVTKKTFVVNEQNELVKVNNDVKEGSIVFAGYNQNDELVGVAVEASGMGFADVLKVLYGYDPRKEAIVGFYVLESKETPGLGDKIEKDAVFLSNFKELDVSLADNKSDLKNTVVAVKSGTKKNPWEIDGITGATISSRAIGNIFGQSTQQWVPMIYKNKEVLELSDQSMPNNE
jgi:electron transport complex protein RnfG